MVDISLYISYSFGRLIVVGRHRPLLPRFWPRIWVSKFCDGSVTLSILLFFPFKDSHSIPWVDGDFRFLLTASHLPRSRVCPPCDLALLLRFCLFHWALVWLYHLVRFCDVALLLRLLPDVGNESVTFFPTWSTLVWGRGRRRHRRRHVMYFSPYVFDSLWRGTFVPTLCRFLFCFWFWTCSLSFPYSIY